MKYPKLEVKPKLFRWARERAGLETADLVGRFPNYREWEGGKLQPTVKQVENFAKAVYVAEMYLYLPDPPKEEVDIPDFRTVGDRDKGRDRLSPNLIDTIESCELRQSWFREEYAEEVGLKPLGFVGSASVKDSADKVAADIREILLLDSASFKAERSVEVAFSSLLSRADEAGILVMVSGIVGNNTRRQLDPQEFRGFALSDALAPLIFINAKDAKAAQLFTLAHEIAHIWLGESAVSDAIPLKGKPNAVEKWCNGVAAELLVSREDLLREFRKDNEIIKEISRLVRRYKVCSLVIVRRLLETRLIDKRQFDKAFPLELSKFVGYYKTKPNGRGGGGKFRTQLRKVGRRFAKAVVSREAERKVVFRDALNLLSLKNEKTFDIFADELEKAG